MGCEKAMAESNKHELLFPIRFSFDGQQFHVVIKIIRIGWFKHDPFSVTIGFCCIILPANRVRKSTPYIFKFCSFILPENNHKSNAIFFRI